MNSTAYNGISITGTRYASWGAKVLMAFVTASVFAVGLSPYWTQFIPQAAPESLGTLTLNSLGLFIVILPPWALLVLYFRLAVADETVILDKAGCQVRGSMRRKREVNWCDVVDIRYNIILDAIIIQTLKDRIRIQNLFEEPALAVRFLFLHLSKSATRSKLARQLEEDTAVGFLMHPFYFGNFPFYYFLYYLRVVERER